MNRAELITLISRRAAISKKDAETFLGALMMQIKETVQSNDSVRIDGFGIFEMRTRMTRSCKDGKEEFSACKIPIFKPDKKFENLLNK